MLDEYSSTDPSPDTPDPDIYDSIVSSYDAAKSPKTPKAPPTKIQQAADILRSKGLDVGDDVVDDFSNVTGLESSRSHYYPNGQVKRGVPTANGERAIGFSQVMPSTAAPYKKKYGLDPFNEIHNIAIGLNEYQNGAGDPIGRRLAYVGGPNSKAVKYYEKTGNVPNWKLYSYLPQNKETYKSYVERSGGFDAVDPYAAIVKSYNPETATTEAPDQPEVDPYDAIVQSYSQQQRPGGQPTPPTNPTNVPLTPVADAQASGAVPTVVPEEAAKPAPETPQTIEAQTTSMINSDSPRSAVLLTEPNQVPLLNNVRGLVRMQLPEGMLVVNPAKLGIKPEEVPAYVKKNGFASLIGKVQDVGNNTSSGPAVLTTDPQGKELSSSVVTTPQAANAQAQVDQASFPGSQSQVVDAQDVVANRMKDLQPAGVAQAPNGMPPMPVAQTVAGKKIDGVKSQGRGLGSKPLVGTQDLPVEPGEGASAVEVPTANQNFTRTVSFENKPKDVTNTEYFIQSLVPELTTSIPGVSAIDVENYLRNANFEQYGKGLEKGTPLSKADHFTMKVTPEVVSDLEAYKNAREANATKSLIQGDTEAAKAQGLSDQDILNISTSPNVRAQKQQYDAAYQQNLAVDREPYAAKLMTEQQMGWRADAEKESKAYYTWAQQAGFDSDEYRQAHSQALADMTDKILKTYGSFANLDKQVTADQEYYKDKPLLSFVSKIQPLFGNDTNAKDNATQNMYFKAARMSDAERENATKFGEGLQNYLELSGGDKLKNSIGSGVIVGLANDALNLGAGVLRYGAPVLNWATGGKGADWLERAAQQTQLAGEQVKDNTGFEVGLGGGQLPGIAGATVATGGNPILGFTLHSLLTNSGKPIDEQVTKGYQNATMALVFEGAPLLDGIGGKTLDSLLEKVGLASDAKPAEIIQTLFEKGKRIGTMSGIGAEQAAVEGGDVKQSALQMGLMELGFSAFGHKPTDAEWTKMDGKVVRIPDDTGKPKDILLTKNQNGVDATDVTGLVPEGVQQAVMAPNEALNVKPNEAKTEVPSQPAPISEAENVPKTETPTSPEQITGKTASETETEKSAVENNAVAPESEMPKTVTHPDENINGKEIIAETQDGKVVVANPENKSGVSIVTDRTEAPKIEEPVAPELSEAAKTKLAKIDERIQANEALLGEAFPDEVKEQYQQKIDALTKQKAQIESRAVPKPAEALPEPDLTPTDTGGELDTKGAEIVSQGEPRHTGTPMERTIKSLRGERDLARRQAETSAVTGLPNKVAFEKARPRIDADPNQEITSIDLNNFKQINDKNSHIVGDRALRDAGQDLLEAAKKIDPQAQVFHLSGDEYAIASKKGLGDQIRREADTNFRQRKYGEVSGSVGGETAPTYAEAEAGLQAAKKAQKLAIQHEQEGLSSEESARKLVEHDEEQNLRNTKENPEPAQGRTSEGNDKGRGAGQEEPINREGKTEEPGPGKSDEPAEIKEPSPTSTKNETVAEERTKRGMEPAKQAAKKDFGQTWDEALKKIDTEPGSQDRLIKELRRKPRPVSDVENALLLHRQIELQNAYDGLTEQINKLHDDGGNPAELQLQLARTSDDLLELYNIGKATGTETARGLSARRMLANQDFTLASLERQKRAANGGRQLTESELDQLKTLAEQYKASSEDLIRHLAESELKRQELINRQPPKPVLDMAEKIVEKLDARANAARERLKKRGAVFTAGLDPVALKDLAEIGASHIAKIGLDFAKWSDKMISEFGEKIKPHLESVWAAANKAFEGIGNDRVASTVGGYKTKLENRINELESAIANKERIKPSERKAKVYGSDIEALKTQRDALKDQYDHIFGKPHLTDEQRLDLWKKRAAKQLEDLKTKVANEDFTKAVKREPVPLDQEAQRLRVKIEGLKKKIQEGLIKDRLKNRTAPEKMMDLASKYVRAAMLTGVTSLGKLTSAALERPLLTIPEHIVGGVYSKMLPSLAKKAMLEGGLNVRAEAKAVTAFFTKGLSDSWKILTSGKSDLETEFGKLDIPHTWIEFMGTIHGALKAPAKRAEFTRSYEIRATKYAEAGVDITDPLVQARIGVEAYKDAERAIFMQDNRVVGAYKMAMRHLGKPAQTVANIILPIVKIPTNIVAETATYAGGLYAGGGRIIWKALKGTLKDLTPEESEQILRQLKKGSIGTAALLIGYANPNNFGGYYQPGQKRDENDVKAGQMRIDGVNIPSWLIHNPLLETFQIGATMRRVGDSYRRKGDKNPQGLFEGTMAGLLGLTEEVPFVKETVDLSKLFDPRERSDFINKFVASRLVPQGVQQVAALTDKTPSGDYIKRKPEGLMQNIEAGIPYLRKSVPVAANTLEKKGQTQQDFVDSTSFNKRKVSSIIDQVAEERAAGNATDVLEQGLKDRIETAVDKGKFSQSDADRANRLLGLEGKDAYQASDENLTQTDAPTETYESETGFLHHLSVVAEALGTDPMDVFKKWYEGETIRKMKNGVIIVERMPRDASEAIKRKRGAGKEMILDHTTSLELGGGNTEDNVKVVPKDVWESYTPVENALGKALEQKKISGLEAQRMVRDFKDGTISLKQVADRLGVSEDSLRPR
jgi:GGDEF domain-containing protein